MCTIFGVGGIARHTLGLGRWLKQRGYRIYLARSHGDWVNEDAFDGFLQIDTLKVGGEGGAPPRRLGDVARSVFALRQSLKALDIDLIHAHESVPALVALMARAGLGIPLVVTYHGSDPQRTRGFGRVARHAEKVITPSYRAAEDLERLDGVPKKNLGAIGLGVDPAPPDEPKDVAVLPSELLSDGTHLVVTNARIAYQKGTDILIDCVARIKDSYAGARFVVIGDGPLDREMRELARRKGVVSHLLFAGWNDTLFRYLRAADVMLLTSRWQALPISIVQPFQTGTPVVAMDCSGVSQLVDESVGACVPIGDVETITDAVTHILDNNETREDMTRNALRPFEGGQV